MTKTMTTASFGWLKILLAIILLIPAAMAQDFNTLQGTSGMTSEQIQAYIQQQVLISQQTQQPQIVTVQMDQDLLDRLDLIQGTVIQTKNEVAQMQGRFNTLSNNMENLIVNQAVGIVQQGNEDRQAQFNDNVKILKNYINYATNPVRTNLPIIGVFLILTSAFLLWASKQYKLTEGARKPYEFTEPKKVLKEELVPTVVENDKMKREPVPMSIKPEEKPKKRFWKKLPVKTTKQNGTQITEVDQIMLSSLPMSTKIKLLKQLEGDH